MKKTLFVLLSLLMLVPLSTRAGSDSLVISSSFKLGEVVMPLSLIGVGALGFAEPLKSARYEVADCFDEWRGDHRMAMDEYLRFVPFASVYGLSLLGAEAKHNYLDRTLSAGVSTATLFALAFGLKHVVHSPRPDGLGSNSFPSGHVATAFMGAELVRIEYGDDSPWYSVGAYTIAATVGALRVYNDKHWFTDVIAGAGVGILSARIGYWLLPYTKRVMYRVTGWDAFLYPVVNSEGATLGVVMRF